MIKRRHLLAGAISAAATACGSAPGLAQPNAVVPQSALAASALNNHARARGLFYGSAVSSDLLAKDPAAMLHVGTECGMVVSEAAFKWADLHQVQGKYDFTRADALMDWAIQHNLRVRGHTLVWHEGNPDWLAGALAEGKAASLLRDHIKNVAGRYAGRLAHWDVVNEVINPVDKQPRGLRATPWLRALGPSYIDIAFHSTAEADPNALRVLNEFGTDYALDWQEARRVALLNLLADLVRRGVPIQAVGLQAHLDASITALDQNILSRFVGDIAAMGLKIIVTELDVRDDRLPADLVSRDIAVANHARTWLDAVLPNPAVLGVLTWGITDRHSWLNDKFPRPDGLPQRSLPLDTDLNRKRLWAALADSLDAAPGRVGAG
jgi:endo-1,4-beta-xylanase